MSNDNNINELIEAIAKIDERLNKHELTTQKELKIWSQTNLELMSIINRQGTEIEAFGETAKQMAQLWQQSANWEERSKPEQRELMQEQRNLLEKQQQWQTACDEGVMELTENLTKEIQGVKGQVETIQKTVQDLNGTLTTPPKDQPQMPISAAMQKELETIKTAIAAVSTGKAIDYTKMEIPKTEGIIKEWSGKILSFRINGILVSALLVGSLGGGFIIKQQETFSAFGGEDRYHIGRMLINKYSNNGEKLKKCFDDKQKECQLQIADQKEEPGVKKGKKKTP
jgi:small-conductance mechanosensitive channel